MIPGYRRSYWGVVAGRGGAVLESLEWNFIMAMRFLHLTHPVAEGRHHRGMIARADFAQNPTGKDAFK